MTALLAARYGILSSMSLAGLSSDAAAEIIILSGAFTTIWLIIIHGPRWITARAEARKTRKDERRQPDDGSERFVQDQRLVGGSHPASAVDVDPTPPGTPRDLPTPER